MTKEQQMEQLGQELAARCNFNKDEILEAAMNALTDANFHDEAIMLSDLITYGY
jgi:hypothetical protein